MGGKGGRGGMTGGQEERERKEKGDVRGRDERGRKGGAIHLVTVQNSDPLKSF